jgi:para-nitrobenzyl esterase
MNKHEKTAFASSAPRKAMTRALLLGSWLAAGVLATAAMAWDQDEEREEGPVVKTADGPVRGFERHGVREFLGIPYAAPPVGDLRWMPPQPVTPWNEPLKATKFRNTCPQVTELGAFAGPTSITEDCLYLNVFTTRRGARDRDRGNAVLVWIHGGGNVDGESNDYDASKLATNGIVVVTINYRMGLFGFLSQTALNSEGHPWGNYGILDQQAALRWVKANIAAFGGDPTTVALGGQSAGSQDTDANLVSPGAAGLFNRAIQQSAPFGGNPVLDLPPASAALTVGNNFAAAAGCSTASCLRGLSAARILQLQGTPNANGPYIIGPFVDGTILPIPFATAWSTGRYNKMPIMGGSVKDEVTFFSSITEYFSGPPQVPLTPAQYAAGGGEGSFSINLFFGSNAPAVLAEYPISNYNNDPELAYDRAVTDGLLKCPSLHALKAQAASDTGNGVFGYDFTYQHAPYYFPQMPNPASPTGYFQPLAAHTIDIQFLFVDWHGGQLGVNLSQDAISPANNQPRNLQGSEIGLSDQLVAAWTNFVKTGNPNGTEAPVWPVFTPSSSTFLQEDIPNSLETEAQYRANYKCDFWDSLPPQV